MFIKSRAGTDAKIHVAYLIIQNNNKQPLQNKATSLRSI